MSIKNKMTGEYLDDLLVRMAHHSTAIEGNTLSQADTASILLYQTIPARTSEREFYEVKNYRKTMEYLLNDTSTDGIFMKTIKEYHELIMQNIIKDNGEFKKGENRIVGASFTTARSYEVPSLLQAWCDTLNSKLETASSADTKIEIIMSSHIDFERIHPFSDGNGRTGRMLLIDSCIRQNIAPIIIPKEEKQLYINLLDKNEKEKLGEWGKELSKKENIIMEEFLNKEKNLLVEKEPSKGSKGFER